MGRANEEATETKTHMLHDKDSCCVCLGGSEEAFH